MFLMNDGTTEDVRAVGQVLVAHRYNCNDKPLNVSARKELYVTKGNNKVTSKLVTLATLPQLKMLRAYTHRVPITPLKIGWETQCCMAGRRFKENSTSFVHPQASARVPDGDKLYNCPTNECTTTSVRVHGKKTVAKGSHMELRNTLNFEAHGTSKMSSKLLCI